MANIIMVLLLPQQTTSVGSFHTRVIKLIVLNNGVYIDSQHTDAVVGINLRLGRASFTKTP